jgi:hypothetical protein
MQYQVTEEMRTILNDMDFIAGRMPEYYEYLQTTDQLLERDVRFINESIDYSVQEIEALILLIKKSIAKLSH